MSVFQLRRIGLPPSIDDAKSCYLLSNKSYVGRSKDSDIYLDSNIRKGLISRSHAHILKQISFEGDVVYEIYDSSLNGTYVNDFRIKDSQILKDGDKIAFGHLRGAIIDQGEYAPQKETEFLFVFEKTLKVEIKEVITDPMANKDNVLSVFLSPESTSSPLPGILSTINNFDGNAFTPLRPLRDANLNRIKYEGFVVNDGDNDDGDLSSIISNVTSKILNGEKSSGSESFGLDMQNINPTYNENHKLIPNHPRKGLIRSTTSDSSKSFSSFSDHDIKRDTSLNITHIYENVEPQSLSGLRSKVREVLSSRSRESNVNNNIKKREEIVIPIDDDENFEERESIFTDKSEEITDSDSDSDFVPSKSGSSDSIHSIEEEETIIKRTRKTPQRFSPNQQKKRLKIENQRPYSPPPKHNNETPQVMKKFAHDKCAAWDCVKPSGSIKKITWVACDDCDAWYHVYCSGLTAKDAMKPDTKYHCGCA